MQNGEAGQRASVNRQEKQTRGRKIVLVAVLATGIATVGVTQTPVASQSQPRGPSSAPSDRASLVELAAQDGKSPGQEPYDRVCKVCHGPEGQGDSGPRLVPSNREYEELLGIVREGLEMMPPISERRLSDEEVAQITKYLQSLSKP